MTAPFHYAKAAERLGPAAVEAARSAAAAAPPFTVEQREHLRFVFAVARREQRQRREAEAA